MSLLSSPAAAWAFALAIACVAAWCDARTRRIPNGLTLPAIVVGLAFGLWPEDPIGIPARVFGLALAFVPCFLLFHARVLGGGDVKLFAALGALIGADAVLPLLLHSFLGGTALALAWVALRGQLVASFRELGGMLRAVAGGGSLEPTGAATALALPLAPAILLGLVWTGLAASGWRIG